MSFYALCVSNDFFEMKHYFFHYRHRPQENLNRSRLSCAIVVGMECSIYVQRSVIRRMPGRDSESLLCVSEKKLKTKSPYTDIQMDNKSFRRFHFWGNEGKQNVKSRRGVLKRDPMADAKCVSQRSRGFRSVQIFRHPHLSNKHLTLPCVWPTTAITIIFGPWTRWAGNCATGQ